mmetsp:Transcript_631/g.1447  ORF Transcript_631/g.1447 Transcript_631/m.1447 type:complete len:96 (-) Transcript_631:340-627(-)
MKRKKTKRNEPTTGSRADAIRRIASMHACTPKKTLLARRDRETKQRCGTKCLLAVGGRMCVDGWMNNRWVEVKVDGIDYYGALRYGTVQRSSICG